MAVLTSDMSVATRQGEVENALASVRLEGLEPSAEALELFHQYADGQIDSEELDVLFAEHIDRTYGPLHVPGNERP
jgi:3,4-dihydroxy-2-butanone 4-phosphate synthase